MAQGISSVSERLEHIETLSRETRDELREVLGALGRLAERSDAHNQALADMRTDLRSIVQQQHIHAVELAKLPAIERSLFDLEERHRVLDARVGAVERFGERSGLFHKAAGTLAGHAVGLIFGLMLAGIVWLSSLSGKIPPGAQ